MDSLRPNHLQPAETALTEAVIQFRYTLAGASAEASAAAATLAPVFRRAQQLGVMGRDPARYDGLAFGNLSYGSGAGPGFWITATQTADRPSLAADDVVHIDAWDLTNSSIAARGSQPPSSEALSHAAIHGARPNRPTWVLHGHAPDLWHSAEASGWPITDRTAANGSLALARAVAGLTRPDAGIIIMGGHTDGVLAYAGDGSAVLALLVHALDCAQKSPPSPPGQSHARPPHSH